MVTPRAAWGVGDWKDTRQPSSSHVGSNDATCDKAKRSCIE